MNHFSLNKSVQVVILVFFVAAGFYYARPLLVPLFIAALLAVLFLPVNNWLQAKGFSKTWAALVSVISLVLFIALIVGLISWQVSELTSNASEIEKNLTEKINQVESYIAKSFGVSQEKQQQMMKQQQESAPGKINALLTQIAAGTGTFLTGLLLVFVYFFIFLISRSHLKAFFLKLFARDTKKDAQQTLAQCAKVTQKYLTGLALMIVGLWIMYGIGFSILGVKYAIFFAILCGLLEIVPFVGNLFGNLITILMTIAQGGSMTMVIGILITYGLVQFIQTYILEPLVVGREVSINPLFTIAGIVAGELIWGIPGMVLAIPLIAVFKIVCDHVTPLQPFGFLVGTEEEETKNKKGRTT